MSENLVQSLLRGIDILELVGEANDGLKLKDICAKLDLKIPTAHNLLKTLVSRGFLTKDAETVYFLGPRLKELGTVEVQNRFFSNMEELFLALRKKFPDSIVVYSEYFSGEIRVLTRMIPENKSIQHPHSVLKMYSSASGLVYMAFSDKHERSNIGLANPFWEHGAHLWGSPEKLEAYIDEVGKSGVAIYPFREDDYFRFALPVFTKGDCLKGALGVSLIKNEHSNTENALPEIIDTVKSELSFWVKK